MSDTRYATPAPRQVGRRSGLRRFIGVGVVATLAAMAANALSAALVRTAGVDFVIPNGGEIPVSGIAAVTGFFSIVGVVLAAGFQRWSTRPADRFRWTAVALTAVSLIPPLLSGASAATTTALIGLHLIAAAVMIPVLVRGLRGQRQDRGE